MSPGRTLVAVLIKDVIDIFFNPDWVTFSSFFIDTMTFLFDPLVGGFVNASVTVNYSLNESTYLHAELDKNYLYDAEMILVKDWVYSNLGRPNFFD